MTENPAGSSLFQKTRQYYMPLSIAFINNRAPIKLMIIPIRCYTCGKPIGNLWDRYRAEVAKGRKPGDVLDRLGLERYCCRSIFLTHVDLAQKIARFKK